MSQVRWLMFYAVTYILLMFADPVACQLNQFTSASFYYPSGNGVAPSFTVKSDPPSGTLTYTTDNKGGTTTSVLPARAIPTLVYNCAYMPFICKNIDNHIANQGQWKFDQNGLMKLHYDGSSTGAPKGKKNNDLRRKQTCQNKGKKNPSIYHAKGFPNQCQNAATLWNIKTLYSYQFPLGLDVASVDKQPIIIQGPVDPTDPNEHLFSGLVYTCDEFPSASWIEGGRGLGSTKVEAEVICAPQGASCGAGSQAIQAAFGQVIKGKNPSEQDWQGHALSGLGAAVQRAHKINIPKQYKDFNPNIKNDDAFVAVFFLSTTRVSFVTSRAWVIDEAQQTINYVEKRAMPTARPKKRRALEMEPVSPFFRMAGNESEAEAVPTAQIPTPGAAARAPVAQATAMPTWRHNPEITARAQPKLTPRGVYHLRGRDVPAGEIQAAEDLLAAVAPEIQAANARKLAHPRVMPDKDTSSSAEPLPIDDSVPQPTSQDYAPVNATVREAAALVAEFDAKNGKLEYTWPLPDSTNSSRKISAAAASSYWYSQISPKGSSPFNPAGSSYHVYKDAIADCGAKGNGQDDDTKAIQDCIAAQNRCGGPSLSCTGTSVMPLIIYFPPGTYLISSHIEMYFQTLLIGDPITQPVLLAAPKFQGLGVLSSDFYIEGANGAEWFVNQNNFMRQVRNFVIDIRNTPDNPTGVPAPGPACLHWQVAQATSLQNIDLYMKEGSRGHVGIFMENGSGGLITGVNFHGGYVGLRAGNQQFTIKNLNFANTKTAIQAIWDWTFLWQNIVITGATTGIDLINQDLKNTAKSQQTFAYLLVDSAISATTGIRTNPFMASDGYAQMTLDNVDFAGSGTAIKQTTGETVMAGGPHVDQWMWGIVATKDSPTGKQIKGDAPSPLRNKPAGLLGGPHGGYFDRPKPQYETIPASSFKNALSNGCKGDGKSDDTDCLKKMLGSPGYVFLPAGVYRATDTIKIVPGVKLVGEAWSAITAAGSQFNDMTKPKVLVQVGNAGQVGDVEISDVLFQVEGPMAGAVLLEWNLRASSPGSAGMWDTHFRVGGNAGSNLQQKDCPRLTGAVNQKCIAASLMMHVTPYASGYFENIWGWTADHDLETKDAIQIDIYSGRGVLIESTNPTWFYASAFEHNVMYQYLIRGANNLFLGLIQTESPYFQSSPPAPKPFDKSIGKFIGDPSFSGCRTGSAPDECMAWGLMIEGSSNVLIYGAGLYSWFQKYSQGCLSQFNCQSKMVYLAQDKNIFIYNLATVGTTSMLTSPGARLDGLVHNSPNSNVSSINGWLGDADGSLDSPQNATITLSKSIWLWPETQSDGKGTMTIACTSSCVFDFPPITYPALQPPPVTKTFGGSQVVVTPPVVSTPVIGWIPVPYNESSGVITVTPTPNVTAIAVPPWPCGAPCGGAVITFPPIPIPPPMPTDAPCWIFCNNQSVGHPAVVIGPGPAPGPPPPGSDDNRQNGTVIFPFPDCSSKTCPSECSGPDCTQGTDCNDDSCVKGGDCIGPKCTRGGDCTGKKCRGGGDCHGDGCDHGGGCKGDGCDHGGDCIGLFCHTGGSCIGLFCTKGGGCEGPACTAPKGPCTGSNCGKGSCVGAGCGPPGGGCTGPNCDPGNNDDDNDDDDDDDDEDEDEEPEFCALNPDLVPNTDTTDDTGMGVSGYTGADSSSGGNVGQGGVNGSGSGCLDDDGTIYACPNVTISITSTSRLPPTSTRTTTSVTRVCTVTDVCNCNEDLCDECSPACCQNGTCPTSTPIQTTTSKDACADFDCRGCGSPFDDPCCSSSHCRSRKITLAGGLVVTTWGTVEAMPTTTSR